MIDLEATIYSIRTDREGESRITFDVSLKYLTQAMSLSELLGQPLAVRVAKMDGEETP